MTPAQNSLTGFESVNQPTMSSLEMVEFINSQRQTGEPDVLHKNFLAKVPVVLGERSAEFLADLPDAYGRPRRFHTSSNGGSVKRRPGAKDHHHHHHHLPTRQALRATPP